MERVDILPFHQMGLHKWEEIEQQYKLKDVPTPTQAEIENAESIFRNNGLKLIY